MTIFKNTRQWLTALCFASLALVSQSCALANPLQSFLASNSNNSTICIVPPASDSHFVDARIKALFTSQLPLAISVDGLICNGLDHVIDQQRFTRIGYEKNGRQVSFFHLLNGAMKPLGKISLSNSLANNHAKRITWRNQAIGSEVAISQAIAHALTTAMPQIEQHYDIDHCPQSSFLKSHQDIQLSEIELAFKHIKGDNRHCYTSILNYLTKHNSQDFLDAAQRDKSSKGIDIAFRISKTAVTPPNYANKNSKKYVSYKVQLIINNATDQQQQPIDHVAGDILAVDPQWQYITEQGIGLCNKSDPAPLRRRKAIIAANIDAQAMLVKRIYPAVITRTTRTNNAKYSDQYTIEKVSGTLRSGDYQFPKLDYYNDDDCIAGVTIRMLRSRLQALSQYPNPMGF